MARGYAPVVMRGGLNIITPQITIPGGMVISCSNYDPDVRGYRRMQGYERSDGRPRPSEASYWVLNFDAGSAAISEGDTVTGATSSATGIAVIDAVVESGAYGTSDAAGYLVLYNVSGTFQDNENLQVSASTKCVANGTAEEEGADNDTDDQTWIQAAIAARRAVIAKATGSGAIRGGFVLEGVNYCIRDNAGATAGILYKATTSGWVAQDLGSILRFDAGTAVFTEGDTLTGGTSSATATVRRVVLQSGTWAGSDATGFLLLSGITGTFQDNETITSAAGSATANGTVTANALPAGGHYDHVVHNFYGALESPRVYACNGLGRAFEWDGTYFCPIETGLSSVYDKPTHISVYKNHLFLGYVSGTVQCSEIGSPLEHTASGGAISFDFGSEITDLLQSESDALIITARDKIGYLVGNDSDDFVLRDISNDSGAVEWTAQVAGSPVFLDDAGVRSLETTQDFGNWRLGTLTRLIEPLFKAKRARGVTAVASIRYRARDIYRLFFSDKSGVTIYFGAETPECMVFDLDHQVSCTWTGYLTGEDQESLFIGTDDGWVMEMERGTSFDGDDILAFFRLPYNHFGSPATNKAFKQITVELDTGPSAALSVIAEYNYGGVEQPPSVDQAFTISGGGGFWDEANWNEFYWDAQIAGQAVAYIEGFGPNASVGIRSETSDEETHTVASMIIHFSQRGIRY